MKKTIIEVGASDGKHTEVFLDGLVLINYKHYWTNWKKFKKNDSIKYKNNYYFLKNEESIGDNPEFSEEWKLIEERPFKDSIIYSFEPNRKIYHKLIQKFNNENVFFYDKAIDIEETRKPFNVDASQSSLYEYTDNINELWGDNRKFKVVKRIEVSTLRLDTFITENQIKNIDFLWIDAQGNDFNVLKSLGSYVDIVEAGICEVSLDISLYKANNHIEDVLKWLQERKFACEIQIVHPGREADIIFKKI